MPSGQVRLQRDLQRVALARRPERRAGLDLLALGVEDADDAEARLDRLVEVEGDARRAAAAGRLRRPGTVRTSFAWADALAGTASDEDGEARARRSAPGGRGSRRQHCPLRAGPATRCSASSTNATRFVALPQAEADREDGGHRLALVDGRVAEQPPAALVPVLGRRVRGDIRPRALATARCGAGAATLRSSETRLQAALGGRPAARPADVRAAASRSPAARGSATRAPTPASDDDGHGGRIVEDARPARSPTAAASAARAARKPARTAVRTLDRRRRARAEAAAAGVGRVAQPPRPRRSAGAARAAAPRRPRATARRRPATTSAPTASSAAATSAPGRAQRGAVRPAARGRCRRRRRARRRRPSPARRRRGTAPARARGSTRSRDRRGHGRAKYRTRVESMPRGARVRASDGRRWKIALVVVAALAGAMLTVVLAWGGGEKRRRRRAPGRSRARRCGSAT